MKPGTDKMMARAALAAERAESHLASGAFDRAGERAYYAVVHAARALLNEVGERCRSHEVIAARIAAMVPPPPPALRQAMASGRRQRAAADDPVVEDIEELVALARAAVDEVRARIACTQKGALACS